MMMVIATKTMLIDDSDEDGDVSHFKVGQSGWRVHRQDKLGEEPQPEGGHAKAGNRAVRMVSEMVTSEHLFSRRFNLSSTCRRS